MPPALMLIGCSVYVMTLLRLEHNQSWNLSRTLWIPTTWMLYIASKPLAVWFHAGGADFESGSPLDRIFLTVLLCIGVVALVTKGFSWSHALRSNVLVVVLLGYMLLSLLWSDIPLVAFKRWTRELIAVVMAFLVSSELDPRQAMRSVFRRTAYVLVPYSLLLIKYFPAYGIEYGRWSGAQMWIGVATQKNSLGRLCLIAVFFLTWALVTGRRARAAAAAQPHALADASVLAIAGFIILGPGGQYSATALMSVSVGLALLWCLSWIRRRGMTLGANSLTLLILVVIAVGACQPFIGGSSVGRVSSSLGRDSTLTGRTEIWEGLTSEVSRQPLLGAGFGSFWTPAKRQMHDIGEAHNGYLDLTLDLGFLGLLLMMAFLVSSVRRACRVGNSDYDWASLWICFLVMASVHNITESSINSFTSHLTAVLLFFSVAHLAPATRAVGFGDQADLQQDTLATSEGAWHTAAMRE